MKFWYEIGVYSSVAGVVIGAATHDWWYALFMSLVGCLNYYFLCKELEK